MPELPEVETTRRGIEPHIEGAQVSDLIIRNGALRWPVPAELPQLVRRQTLQRVSRRAKYLLLEFDHGAIMVHLGMSGSLRVLSANKPAAAHDHIDLCFSNGRRLRFNDARRFGSWLWQPLGTTHKLLSKLGPEPWSSQFDADWMKQHLSKRSSAIKVAIMDASLVVGVGNIYASEALFEAGIRPQCKANRISLKRLRVLRDVIRTVLERAIEAGGTTLRDFTDSDGQPGYFGQQLHVYGREGEPCYACGTTIKRSVMGQRSTFHCPQCQS